MDRLGLSAIPSTSPTLAETMRQCKLRAGLSRAAGSATFVLGSPKAWLGSAFHHVLERIGQAAFSPENVDAVAERLWNAAVDAQHERNSHHPLDRRFGLPPTWPGYQIARASALIRARELMSAGTPETKPSSTASRLDDTRQRITIRETQLTAFNGRLVGRPDVIRAPEIIDYKSGSIVAYDESTQTDVVNAAYVRQLRIYGFLVKESLGWWPSRGRLLPVVGAGIDVVLQPEECVRDATEAVAILDSYNAKLGAGALTEEMASPSPGACKWCPFKLVCAPFWVAVTAEWSGLLDGPAVEGLISEPPRPIHGGAAVAVSLDSQKGSEEPRRVQLAPVNPNIHSTVTTCAVGERVRVVGLRARPDGDFVLGSRTVIARVDDLSVVTGLGVGID